MATNKFPTKCSACGGEVEAGAGTLKGKDPQTDRWLVVHTDGCPVVEAVKASKVQFPPTAEQQAVVDAFLTGESIVVEAGAGAGKTSTLVLIAEAAPTKTMQYIAFNKAIRIEVESKMPSNVKVNNYHQLAWRAICADTPFAERLNSGRMSSTEVARRLGVMSFPVPEHGNAIASWKVAGIVLETVAQFCKSADTEITRRHVPYIDGIDTPGEHGERTYDVNNRLAEVVVPLAEKAWRDLSSPWGQLQFKPDHYLKLWQLSSPRIPAEVILFDEAQDASPVVAAVVAAQAHAQRVYVGDANQAIYEFTGAVNAIADMKASGLTVRQLTKSFRFGPQIAAAANVFLGQLDADIRIEGFDKVRSTVGAFQGEPDAVLTRTNAAAVTAILEAQERGVQAYLVGGGAEVKHFALGARDLMTKGETTHPELICFSSWAEVKQYVAEDEQGAELKLNVDMVERFGVNVILDALGAMPKEEDAELVISTAHKAKGREWDRVLIASDFVKQTKDGEQPQPPSPAELRLRYVAVTRARLALDHSALSEN